MPVEKTGNTSVSVTLVLKYTYPVTRSSVIIYYDIDHLSHHMSSDKQGSGC